MLAHRLWLDGSTVGHRRADVAERLIDGVRERVYGGRLELARHDNRSAAMVLQVFGDGSQPFFSQGAGSGGCLSTAGAKRRSETAREPFDVGRTDRQPVLRLRSGQRRRALDHVKPIHPLRVVGHPPAVGKVTGVADHRRADTEKIGVERHDDVGLVEVVDGVAGRAGRLTQAQPSTIGRDRIILMPMGLRVVLENCCDQFRERRRRNRFGQNPQPRPLGRLLHGKRRLDGGLKGAPGTYLAAIGHGLRPIGIVEAEDGGLREHVGGPKARRMLRISFNFGRPAHMAFDQNRSRDAAERNRARKEQRPARHQILWLTDIRNDLLGRLSRARPDARERERRAHQLEEVATALRIVPLRGLFREFPMQVLAKVRGISQFTQAPPVEAAS